MICSAPVCFKQDSVGGAQNRLSNIGIEMDPVFSFLSFPSSAVAGSVSSAKPYWSWIMCRSPTSNPVIECILSHLSNLYKSTSSSLVSNLTCKSSHALCLGFPPWPLPSLHLSVHLSTPFSPLSGHSFLANLSHYTILNFLNPPPTQTKNPPTRLPDHINCSCSVIWKHLLTT